MLFSSIYFSPFPPVVAAHSLRQALVKKRSHLLFFSGFILQLTPYSTHGFLAAVDRLVLPRGQHLRVFGDRRAASAIIPGSSISSPPNTRRLCSISLFPGPGQQLSSRPSDTPALSASAWSPAPIRGNWHGSSWTPTVSPLCRAARYAKDDAQASFHSAVRRRMGPE